MQKLGEQFKLKQDYLNQLVERSIPIELKKFFNLPGGHSLILRGEAGAGKTTMALQIIESQSSTDNSFFLSTRVSDYLLLRQFPWLGAGLFDEDVVSWMKSNSTWFEELQHSFETERKESLMKDETKQDVCLDKLRRSSLNLEKDPNLLKDERAADFANLENIYSEIKRTLPKRSLVVVDSVDALAEVHGLSNADLVKMLQKDLVEGYGANVVFILESNDRSIDYLVDGSVVLETISFHNRLVRQLRISKLRSCPIEQPHYIYTLNGGRITCFDNINDNNFLENVHWKKESDINDRASFGWSDLDRLTLGGLQKGSIALIELGNDIPTSIVSFVERSLVSNFASMKRGVLWIPLNEASVENARTQLLSTLDQPMIDGHVRILEVAAHSERAFTAPYVHSVEGSDIMTDLKWKNISYSLPNSEAPFLSLVGFDTLESIYGERVSDKLSEHLSAVRRNKGVFVGITSPSTKSNQRLSDIASIHLKIERIDGNIIVYSEKPYTKCNALMVEKGEKDSAVKLIPIL